MTLLELAEACERANGADRELDAAIKAAVGHPWDYAADWGPRGSDKPVAMPYTASLDAAMSLVPDGLHPGVSQNIWHLHWHAWIGRQGCDGSPDDVASTNAATPALALTAAALRARHAMAMEEK